MEKDKPSYYAIIPAGVRYDKDLCSGAKLLYGEITALCNKHGFCWASNKYFADQYETTTRTITNWISALVEKKHIMMKIENKNERQIWLQNEEDRKNLLRGTKKSSKGIEENFVGVGKNLLHNITSNNTINITSNKKVAIAKNNKHNTRKKIIGILNIGHRKLHGCDYDFKGKEVGCLETLLKKYDEDIIVAKLRLLYEFIEFPESDWWAGMKFSASQLSTHWNALSPRRKVKKKGQVSADFLNKLSEVGK